MHYRNGREANNGDKIQLSNSKACKVVTLHGKLHSCDGYDWVERTSSTDPSAPRLACMCDCLHVDDVAAMRWSRRGMDKRPDQGK
jgi:hypothetical protein